MFTWNHEQAVSCVTNRRITHATFERGATFKRAQKRRAGKAQIRRRSHARLRWGRLEPVRINEPGIFRPARSTQLSKSQARLPAAAPAAVGDSGNDASADATTAAAVANVAAFTTELCVVGGSGWSRRGPAWLKCLMSR